MSFFSYSCMDILRFRRLRRPHNSSYSPTYKKVAEAKLSVKDLAAFKFGGAVSPPASAAKEVKSARRFKGNRA